MKGGQLPNQQRPFRLRDELIRKLGKQLKDDLISVDGFLDGIVFNDVCKNKCTFDVDIVSNSDNDSDSDSEPSVSQNNVLQGNTCAICYGAPSDVVLSCGHYKHCLTCFETEKALYEQKKIQYRLGAIEVEPTFICPLCKKVITQHLHVPKIFS